MAAHSRILPMCTARPGSKPLFSAGAAKGTGAAAAEDDTAIHFQGLKHRLGPHLGYDSNTFGNLLFVYFRGGVERTELSQPEGARGLFSAHIGMDNRHAKGVAPGPGYFPDYGFIPFHVFERAAPARAPNDAGNG